MRFFNKLFVLAVFGLVAISGCATTNGLFGSRIDNLLAGKKEPSARDEGTARAREERDAKRAEAVKPIPPPAVQQSASAPKPPANTAVVVGPKPSNGTGPDMFADKGTCLLALETGNYKYYEPKYEGLKKKDPVDGKTRVLVLLESDGCVRMLTVSGRRWVVQKKGTGFRFKASDGVLALIPYARDSCGNPADDIAYFVPKQVSLPPPPQGNVPLPLSLARTVVWEKTFDFSPRQSFAPAQSQPMMVQYGGGCDWLCSLGRFVPSYLSIYSSRVRVDGGQGATTVTPPAGGGTVINTR
ncbi:MAG: hypothetical protein AAB507_02325 [Patescibacteria group bacterium]